jgi:hypothetical protein
MAWEVSYLGAWLALGAQGGSGDALGSGPFELLAQPLMVVNDYPTTINTDPKCGSKGRKPGLCPGRKHPPGPICPSQ